MPTQEKKCSKCGGPGPFTKNRAEPDGLQKWCRPCRKTWAAEHYKKNKKKILKQTRAYQKAHPEQYKKYEVISQERHPVKHLIMHAKSRAKAKGIPFDLKEKDVDIPDKCPLLEIPLQRNKGKVGPDSPTLDRKIPELGYVKGNVWVISHRANVMKNDATLKELELLVKNLRQLMQQA